MRYIAILALTMLSLCLSSTSEAYVCGSFRNRSTEATWESIVEACSRALSLDPSISRLLSSAELEWGCEEILGDIRGLKVVDVADFKNASSSGCNSAPYGWQQECSDDCQKLLHIGIEWHEMERNGLNGEEAHERAVLAESEYRGVREKWGPILSADAKDGEGYFKHQDGHIEHWPLGGGKSQWRSWSNPAKASGLASPAFFVAEAALYLGKVQSLELEVIRLGSSPGVWSGVVASRQPVYYRVSNRSDGVEEEIVVWHELIYGGKGVSEVTPALEPSEFGMGRKVRLDLRCKDRQCLP